VIVKSELYFGGSDDWPKSKKKEEENHEKLPQICVNSCDKNKSLLFDYCFDLIRVQEEKTPNDKI
jgi:hypothetical protein